MMSSSLRIALIAIAVVLSGTAVAKTRKPKPEEPTATAAQPVSLGEFKDWQAFQNGTGKSKSCFAITSPKERRPRLERDPATLFITRRPGEGVRDELSMITGFPMKDGGEATLTVGRTDFDLYTKGSNAWIKNAAQGTAVISAMRKSRTLVFEGDSKRGRTTTDRYSLAGMPQALEAITKGCP